MILFLFKGVEFIGNDWEKLFKLSKCFKLKYMRLFVVMVIFGVVVSYDMGSYEDILFMDMVLDLLNLLGFGMGDEMVSD